MALINTIPLSATETFVNESVSVVSVVNDGTSSFRTVPAGKYWELQVLRAYNAEAAPRAIAFLLVDQDGISHGCLSKAPTARNLIATLEEACWDGLVRVPPLWRVYAKWYAMAGGATCNWQYEAIEKPVGVPTTGSPVTAG